VAWTIASSGWSCTACTRDLEKPAGTRGAPLGVRTLTPTFRSEGAGQLAKSRAISARCVAERQQPRERSWATTWYWTARSREVGFGRKAE
jgi:hypothetical protein